MARKGLEENPWLVRQVETLPGRLILVGVLTLVGSFQGNPWMLEAGIALAALSIWPSRRRLLAAMASAYFLLRWPPLEKLNLGAMSRIMVWHGMDMRIGIVFAVLFSAWLCLAWFRRCPDHLLFRRPVRNLLLLYIALLVAASTLPLPEMPKLCLWGFVSLWSRILWFMAYALSDRKGSRQRSPLRAVLLFQPFWAAHAVPFPKGEANLDHFEAKNDHDLAISQLRGLELFFWSNLLVLAYGYFHLAIMGRLWPISDGLRALHVPMPIPSVEHAVAMYIRGKPLPRAQCWLAAVVNFSQKMLWLFGWGGRIIAICWVAGFKVLPNSDKALKSKTIAEFYNRYYYYFKELLVNFFFYPTFFRYFKRKPRLRIFFATLAAAGFGNAVYHFTQNINFIYFQGLWPALLGFRIYLFYTLILGTAIAFSQLRSMGKPARGGKFTGPLCVLTFYCVVMIMDLPYSTWSIRDVSCFIINLFIPLSR